MDLALNNLQSLICLKTQTNKNFNDFLYFCVTFGFLLCLQFVVLCKMFLDKCIKGNRYIGESNLFGNDNIYCNFFL